MTTSCDFVPCVLCGGVIRLIRPGQDKPRGPGERCGEMELREGRLDQYEKLRRDCLARRRGERSVGLQYALPGQQMVRPQVIRRGKETR